jgi:hypothetical protein
MDTVKAENQTSFLCPDCVSLKGCNLKRNYLGGPCDAFKKLTVFKCGDCIKNKKDDPCELKDEYSGGECEGYELREIVAQYYVKDRAKHMFYVKKLDAKGNQMTKPNPHNVYNPTPLFESRHFMPLSQRLKDGLSCCFAVFNDTDKLTADYLKLAAANEENPVLTEKRFLDLTNKDAYARQSALERERAEHKKTKEQLQENSTVMEKQADAIIQLEAQLKKRTSDKAITVPVAKPLGSGENSRQ